MDRGVDIGGPGADAGLEHGHVDEGRADIDHDLRAGLVQNRRDRIAVHGVDRMGLEHAVLFHRLFVMHALYDRVAFRNRAAGDIQIAQHIVVLRAFMRHDLCDAAGTDD